MLREKVNKEDIRDSKTETIEKQNKLRRARSMRNKKMR